MYEKFKSGKCPTCGHDIEKTKIDEYLHKMNDYAKEWHKWNDKVEKKYPSDILVYTNTYDNLLEIITKASSNNMIIDSISTINKSRYKVYRMTVLVENKEKLEKFMNDLLNLNFIQKVEREVK